MIFSGDHILYREIFFNHLILRYLSELNLKLNFEIFSRLDSLSRLFVKFY